MTGMTRARQREVGALLSITDGLRKEYKSTALATAHCGADVIDYLVLEGGAIFRDYSSKERRKMASEGRAMPDGSYPIANCQDASNAIHAVGRAKPGDRPAVERHIRKRVRALGCTGSIYENWK
jgi:hypothetical protein